MTKTRTFSTDNIHQTLLGDATPRTWREHLTQHCATQPFNAGSFKDSDDLAVSWDRHGTETYVVIYLVNLCTDVKLVVLGPQDTVNAVRNRLVTSCQTECVCSTRKRGNKL